jgi:hypothetical protein
MKVLFVIPHYFKALADRSRYASHSASSRNVKLQALNNVIFNIHFLFGDKHYGAVHKNTEMEKLVNQFTFDFDIKICTNENDHLIGDLEYGGEIFEHIKINKDPLFLGFYTQAIMSEFKERYDYYCYLEDDIIIHDQFFFKKLDMFNRVANPLHLMQPQRFEPSMYNGKLRKNFLTKVYMDYQIYKIKDNIDRYELDIMDSKIIISATTYAHSGCFFLNNEQFKYLIQKPEWANFSNVDRNMALDNAASKAIGKNFRIFKPHRNSMNFFEVEHGVSNMLHQISYENNQIKWSW